MLLVPGKGGRVWVTGYTVDPLVPFILPRVPCTGHAITPSLHFPVTIATMCPVHTLSGGRYKGTGHKGVIAMDVLADQIPV